MSLTARLGPISVIVFMAMAIAIMPIPAFGVLAPFLVKEFGLSATDVGLASAAFGVVGGLTSPGLGRASDQLGPRGALTVLFAVGVAGFSASGMALAPWMLILVMAFAGLGQGIATPATNVAVSRLVAPSSWAITAGVKEAGVPTGALAVGLILPPIALAAGWRIGYLTLALVATACLLGARFVVPQTRFGKVQRRKGPAAPIAPFVHRLTLYGFFIGFGTNAMLTFLPLFAESVLGFDVVLAGFVVASAGAASIVGRLGWSAISARRNMPRVQLMTIASLALAATMLLVASSSVATWLVWPGAVLFGLSAFAWTSVGVMAVLKNIAGDSTGLATGRVILGFGLGLGLGPLAFGVLVDVSGSFRNSLIALATLYLAALLTMLLSKKPFDLLKATGS